jgi:predicted DNA-binding ribbon-helix-helix protein
VSLEDEFWDAFKQIAATRNTRLSDLVTAINKDVGIPIYRQQSVYSYSTTVALIERRTDWHATKMAARRN